MSGRTASRLAWSLCALTVALLVAGLALTVLASDVTPAFDLGVTISLLTLPTVGALVASRRPGNAIGWLFCGAGLMLAAAGATNGYAMYALVAEPGSLPGGVAAAWLSAWLFLPALFGLPPLLFLLFPDGRPLSRPWRAAVALTVASMFLQAGSAALAPGPIEDAPLPGLANPVGIEAGEGLLALTGALGWILGLTSLLLAVAALALRFRWARGDERLQLKWLVYSAVLFALASVAATFTFQSGNEVVGQLVILSTFSAIPVATGVAILRHRLYDIDVVINRTLVYGGLTATLAAAYLGSVLLLQLALSPLTEESDLAIAGSTLAIAALFRPARRRIQQIVDRRFYRRRYDAARTLEGFGARLRDEVDLDSLNGELRAVVANTMQPAHVSLWLRGPEASR